MLRELVAVVALLSASVVGAQHSAGLSLQEAIAQAETSPLARQAQDRIDEAHGLVLQAGLRPNPRLFLQSEDLQPWSHDFDFPNTTEDYAYASQTLELGGKRAGRLDVAQATLRQTEAERDLLRQQIAGRVASAYWSAVVSLSVVHLLERDMVAVDQIVDYTSCRTR